MEKRIGNLDKLRHEFRKTELEKIINKCEKTKVPVYKHEKLNKGDRVIVQELEEKECTGPFIVDSDPRTNNEVEVPRRMNLAQSSRRFYNLKDQSF